jgi:hypothetical protein
VDAGYVCFGVVLGILVWLTVVVPRRVGFDIDWNVYDPRAIPAATLTGALAVIW